MISGTSSRQLDRPVLRLSCRAKRAAPRLSLPTLALGLLATGGCSKGGYNGPLQCLSVADTAAGQQTSQAPELPKARYAELRHAETGLIIPITLDSGMGGSYSGTGRPFEKCDPPGLYYVERVAVTDIGGALVATGRRVSGSTYQISYPNGATLTKAASGRNSVTLQAPATGMQPTVTMLSAGAPSVPQGGQVTINVQAAAAADDCGLRESRFWLTPKASPQATAEAVGIQPIILTTEGGGSAGLRIPPNLAPGEYSVEGRVTTKSGRVLSVIRQNTTDTTYWIRYNNAAAVATSLPVANVTISADPMADRDGPRIASLEASPTMVSRCSVVSFTLRLSDTKPLTTSQEVLLKPRPAAGSDLLTVKLSGQETLTGTLVVPLDAPSGVWYAYPLSFSDNAGNVTTATLSSSSVAQSVASPTGAMSVMATAAAFTVQGDGSLDMTGGSPPDMFGPLGPDMATVLPTELISIEVLPMTPATAGVDAPAATVSWKQGDRLP